MDDIKIFKEYINDDFSLISKLIEDCENTNLPDLELISNKDSYQKIINLGEKVIPYLLNRNNIIWDRALSTITGKGLDPMKHDSKERVIYWQKWSQKNGY